MSKNEEMTDKIAMRIIQSMAHNRNNFKNKVGEYIGGALIEFYKAQLATKNGQFKYVSHWMSEVDSLLKRSLFVLMKHPIRGFKNRRKAVEEMINYLKSKDKSYRRGAEHIIKKDFGLTNLKSNIDDTDTHAFWEVVYDVIDNALTDEE